MKFAIYTGVQRGLRNYSRFFREGEPVEVHLKCLGVREQYLVRKHTGFQDRSKANVTAMDFRVLASYSGCDLPHYSLINKYFLWLRPDDLTFIESNAQLKQVLVKLEED